MKLYKSGCDPIVVTNDEAVDYHKTQGWVEDEDDVVEIAPVEVVPPVVGASPDGLDPIAAVDADVQGLKEALAAKDQVIADMDEIIKGLNAKIKGLTAGAPPAPAVFGLPAVDPAPAEPTNNELKAQLDAAGIKYGPQDNKATLTALLPK